MSALLMFCEEEEHQLQMSALAALAEFAGKPIRRVTFHRLAEIAEDGLV